MIADHFAAEIFKLARRPASWVLGTIAVAGLLLFSYLFVYAFATSAQGGNAPPGVDPEALLQPLLPENVLAAVLSNFSGLSASIAVVFGALVVGSEYGWGTIKLVLSQRPGKLYMLYGKLLAIGAVLAGLSVVILLISVICSALVAGLQDRPSDWPSFWEVMKGLGAGWLILAAWSSLGAFLAILFRGAALAIGVGLVYSLVIEGLALGLPITGDTFKGIQKVLLGKNAIDLASAFGKLPQTVPQGETVAPTQAVFVLLAYMIAFLVISALLFRRGDV